MSIETVIWSILGLIGAVGGVLLLAALLVADPLSAFVLTPPRTPTA